jgi:hypothetical protein
MVTPGGSRLAAAEQRLKELGITALPPPPEPFGTYEEAAQKSCLPRGAQQGLMRWRIASINDLPIKDSERKYHWLLGRRPDDHPSLSNLSL